ncbi:MAG: hypothetical protein IJ799_02625 [Bacteroidales bacterium]|nr:hypothetical protein [Bacteroidales bacterium]
MVRTYFRIALLALLFNPLLAYTQVNLSEVGARYASLDEVHIKERLDAALPRSYVELEYYERAISEAIEEYNYCEEHCKKIYMLRFVVDWPLYRRTGDIELILDNDTERYDILYIDESVKGKQSFRSVLLSSGNHAEIHRISNCNKVILQKALSYNPKYILSFVHSIFRSYVFVVDDKLLCYGKGRFWSLDSELRNNYKHFDLTQEEDMASSDFAR